jgi:uncharacterized membrane protein
MAAFTIGEVFSQSWAITKPNIVKIWGYTLILGLVSFGFNLSGSFMGENAQALISLLGYVISLVLTLGYTRVMLKLADGQTAAFEDLFWFEGKVIWGYFVASILYSLFFLGGIFLLVIPGIIWGIGFWMYTYAIVDKQLGARESLKYSWRIMRGNKFKYFVLSLVISLMNMGAALLFLIPLLVTIPLSIMITVVVYRKLSLVETQV